MTPGLRTVALKRAAARRRSSDLVFAISVALSVVSGAAVAQGRVEVALAAAGGLFGLATLRYLSLTGWCLLLLLTTVAMRGVVTALGLPQSLNFLHYPVAVGFAIAALQRPFRPASRAPAIWLVGFLLVSVASMLANLSHPLRAVLFLIITGEPLLIVWALSRWHISDDERRNIGRIVLVLAAVQLPIGLLQAASGGWGDAVQGTLAGHGAGSHVLGGLFGLGLLVVTAAIVSRAVGIAFGLMGGAVSVAMMLATGSMAVTILTALVVTLVPALAVRRPNRAGGRKLTPRYFTAVAAGMAFGVAALFLANVLVSSIFVRTERLATEEESSPELQMLSERAHDPGLFVFGSGPGTSASRASTLLIGAEEKGSPLAFFGLEPTAQALEIASSTRQAGGGSAEAYRSSALGIIGDLGVLGFAGLIVLFVRLWREARLSNDWLAPAARGALVLTALLIFVDSWLEYPEFAVPLALLIGIVLSRRFEENGSGEVPVPMTDRRRWSRAGSYTLESRT